MWQPRLCIGLNTLASRRVRTLPLRTGLKASRLDRKPGEFEHHMCHTKGNAPWFIASKVRLVVLVVAERPRRLMFLRSWEQPLTPA